MFTPVNNFSSREIKLSQEEVSLWGPRGKDPRELPKAPVTHGRSFTESYGAGYMTHVTLNTHRTSFAKPDSLPG